MNRGERNTHRFAIFLSICILLLITAGSFVTSTDSGLAVPDWPNTYGENLFLFPFSKWIGGIFYEHFHRLIASAVGLFTIILAILLKKYEPQKFVVNLGYLAIFVVILQGVLGGLTVLFLLPPAISISHATLAQTFLCIATSIAFFTSSFWKEERLNFNIEVGKKYYRFAILVFCAVFLQLIFGATMRHFKSGLAVADWPLAFGEIFPSLDENSILEYNNQLINQNVRLFADGAITWYQLLTHMLHRTWAYFVSFGIIFLVCKILKNKILSQPIKNVSYFLILILITQFTLGVLTVLTKKYFIIASIHVTFGALTLAVTLILLLMIYKNNKSKIISL